MYAVRRWSVRHARGMEIFYAGFERVFVALHPLWKAIGYERLDSVYRKFGGHSCGRNTNT